MIKDKNIMCDYIHYDIKNFEVIEKKKRKKEKTNQERR